MSEVTLYLRPAALEVLASGPFSNHTVEHDPFIKSQRVSRN